MEKQVWTVVWTGVITALIFVFIENRYGPLLGGNVGPAQSTVAQTSLAAPNPGTPVVQAAQPITEAAFNVPATTYRGAFGTTGPEYQGREVIMYQ